MDESLDNNKIIENNSQQEDLEFQFNFVNTPWDDRSSKSKAGIVILLISIFVATVALVVNSFFLHYKGFESVKTYNNSESSCFRVKFDDARYAARIHSASTQQLLCVGAVISVTSVIANGICVKSGAIRMYLGSILNPRCKKGFSVDLVEPIHHDGVISKRLVLLSSYESIQGCSEVIPIGHKLNWTARVHILGRPMNAATKSLSRQHVRLIGKNHGNMSIVKQLRSNSTICVKGVARCPVRAGDLMLQNGKLYGLASTSAQRYKVACFADLQLVQPELKELDPDI